MLKVKIFGLILSLFRFPIISSLFIPLILLLRLNYALAFMNNETN